MSWPWRGATELSASARAGSRNPRGPPSTQLPVSVAGVGPPGWSQVGDWGVLARPLVPSAFSLPEPGCVGPRCGQGRCLSGRFSVCSRAALLRSKHMAAAGAGACLGAWSLCGECAASPAARLGASLAPAGPIARLPARARPGSPGGLGAESSLDTSRGHWVVSLGRRPEQGAQDTVSDSRAQPHGEAMTTTLQGQHPRTLCSDSLWLHPHPSQAFTASGFAHAHPHTPLPGTCCVTSARLSHVGTWTGPCEGPFPRQLHPHSIDSQERGAVATPASPLVPSLLCLHPRQTEPRRPLSWTAAPWPWRSAFSQLQLC